MIVSEKPTITGNFLPMCNIYISLKSQGTLHLTTRSAVTFDRRSWGHERTHLVQANL